MPLNPSCRIQATLGHVSADVQGETVVLHRGEGVYYGLNATGAVLWQALQSARTVNELTSLVVAQFDVAEDHARRDVEHLVNELIEKRLVEELPD